MKKYRVWSVVNVPNKPRFYYVDSPEAGAKKIKALIRGQLHDLTITSNAMGLEELLDGKWVTWYNDQGQDVNEAYAEILKGGE